MMNVFDIADYFLSKQSMSQKKLQKLVYYAYAWTLTLLNENENELSNRLFNDEIQAWVHGPVCPALYEKYKSYGWNNIPKIECDIEKFPEDILDILNQVWSIYGGFNGNQLEAISHSEDPWRIARMGCTVTMSNQKVLDDKIIYDYYSQRINSQI